jgi:glycosyltransferase involved in cell wall biosynthesis
LDPVVSVAYVLRSWPRLSQTFVLNEILELERIGVQVSIFALSRAAEPLVQSQVADVAAPVRYLDGPRRGRGQAHVRLATSSPHRYAATMAFALRHRELFGGYTRSTALEAFDAAVRIADDLRPGGQAAPVTHIHAHFAHDPALIGLLAHRLTHIPFSFTAHARDLYQIPDAALNGRAREAAAVVTCCRTNLEHIRTVVTAPTPIELIYHGVDLGRFQPGDGQRDNEVPVILSIGRLVEKKGFDELLHACALLAARHREFRCEIYGDGPRREDLEHLRDQLALQDYVHFRGARTQAELLPVYQRADVFALTPHVTDDGDRDGVPNVLFEAMACGTPVVSTRVGGIAEVVHDGRDGLLVDGGGAEAIAACLADLLDDAVRRRTLGDAAATSVRRFDGSKAALQLAALFGHADSAAA